MQRKIKMNKIYLFAAIAVVAAVIAAYWSGGRVGTEKCRAEIAQMSEVAQIAAQNQITQTKGKINAETFNTGASDIRNRLRKHYTIKD
jgi:gas vesicle protein